MSSQYYVIVWALTALSILLVYLPWSKFHDFGKTLRRLLDARASLAFAALIIAAVAHYFGTVEYQQFNLAIFAFSTTVTFSIAATLLLVTRRLVFSAFVTAAAVFLIAAAGAAKYKLMNISVHAYDLFFYLASWATLNFLWTDYRLQLCMFAGLLVLAVLVGVAVWKFDRTRIPRWAAVLALILSVSGTWLAIEAHGKPRSFLVFFPSGRHVALFYSSWSDVAKVLWRGQIGLVKSGVATPGGSPLATMSSCETTQKKPHIILIQQESATPPSLFPQVDYNHQLDEFFRSSDDKLHKLRVEIYGGSSWLTKFSVLTGLSTYSFGSMRPFVQPFMAGKLKDTLPQILDRCSYRNVLFYSALRNFVVNDKFYDSIGIKEVFDKAAQGATDYYMRDRFYYTNALNEMERHFAATRQPLFAFIQTMASHGPHDWKFAPELDVPGGAPGTSSELSEYLRRLWIAKMDYDFLLDELRSRFPQESFLIMHYGDHHPLTTRPLIGLPAKIKSEDVLDTVLDAAPDPDSVGSLTYYAVTSLNYALPSLPQYDPLNSAYLGTVLLDLAGLPLPDAHLERKRLMALCQGRYSSCPAPNEILNFHRRLINSGLLISSP